MKKEKQPKSLAKKIKDGILKTCLIFVTGFILLAVVSVIFEDDVADTTVSNVNEEPADTVKEKQSEETEVSKQKEASEDETAEETTEPESENPVVVKQEPVIDHTIKYGYYYKAPYAMLIEFDDSIACDAAYLFENSPNGYNYISTLYMTIQQDESYDAEDVDGNIGLNLYFTDEKIEVASIFNVYGNGEELEGMYMIGDEESSMIIPPRDRSITDAEELKSVISYEGEGITVEFIAEVGGNYSEMGEYLLYLYSSDRSSFLQIRTNSNGATLFDGDIVRFTGIFNGYTGGGNQLSFTTVSIEVQ